jgi:uncharacterized protein DUF4255
MATYNAIAATSEAIRRYLKEAPHPEFPQLDVEIYQSSDFQKSVPAGGRLSLFLYRIGVNTTRRNLSPRQGEDGKTRFRPSLPVDLFYLISAWAMNAEFQQRLLGWCMRTLEDTPSLPASVLNRLQSTAVFRRTETVDLVCDPLSLQDLGLLWEVAKESATLSISYVARMIALDSEIALSEGALVQTRAFDMGVPADVHESLAEGWK